MNGAEWHLAINHLPVFSTLFGSLILLGGLLFKKTSVVHVGYILLLLAGLSSVAAVNSGEDAEEIVENMGNTDHDLIHEHEEMAESAQIFSLTIGGLALIGFFLSYTKRGFARALGFVIVICGIISSIYLIRVAHSGGEIMHKEIRSEFIEIESDHSHEEH